MATRPACIRYIGTQALAMLVFAAALLLLLEVERKTLGLLLALGGTPAG